MSFNLITFPKQSEIIVDHNNVKQTKLAILAYIVEQFCQEKRAIRELMPLYRKFVHHYMLSRTTYHIQSSYLITLVKSLPNLVESNRCQIRYYPFVQYDWYTFYHKLKLTDWQDKHISTEIIYNNRLNLMRDYDIRNKNELHNILKRTRHLSCEVPIHFERRPHLIIGEGNLREQVVTLYRELHPTTRSHFGEVYNELYGVASHTLQFNYLKGLPFQ
ncbi:hypothetical protein N9R04_01665 [Staphylococcus sp. SQ8-PEA]|uniref:Uncharacterized protein n=1 Tax=Staphylococcus marylandisciuri TaxID=2981529 RepID=A0ABT2QN76_9STAP|nr:hypothetical protein [Staphylococcus marylandisciuri]MCU5745428.1 hypothetical protein [Staphylococcus marylandisciuri]